MSIAEQLDAMLGLTGGVTGREMFRSGLTLAKVTNINDEEKLNRVKCLPIGGKEAEETDWCYVMTPMGGNNCGIFFFPQVGDLVVLAYLDDDPHRPLVLGGFWNEDVKPPYTVDKGKLEDYILRTPKKIELLLHDVEEKQKATLTMPSGTVLELDDGNQKVHVQDKNGNNALTMDLNGGIITLKAGKKIEIQAGSATLTLENSGSITLKGSEKISLEGTSIQAKASAKLALEGANSELKGSASLDLNASGPAVLKGAIVKIN